jgi:hypothetical protein
MKPPEPKTSLVEELSPGYEQSIDPTALEGPRWDWTKAVLRVGLP